MEHRSTEEWDAPSTRAILGNYARYEGDTANYYRIVFDVNAADIAWAKTMVGELYHEDASLKISSLARWSLKAVADNPNAEWINGRRTTAKRFEDGCNHRGLEFPDIFRASPQNKMLREDIVLRMDYIDVVALRRHPDTGKLAYYLPALTTVTQGLPSRSLPPALPEAVIAGEPRARIFGLSPALTIVEWHHIFDDLRRLHWLDRTFPSFERKPLI
jgi:hypothetical protein